MIARKIVLKFIHDLSNKLMQLEGRLALFRLNPQNVGEQGLAEVEGVAAETSSMLRNFRELVANNTEGNPLMELTYISDANLEEKEASDVLNEIERSAIEYNEINQISGYLLYRDGQFLQRLEGRQYALEKVYLRIACDKRHRNLTVLSNSVIEERAFKVWRQLSTLYVDGEDDFAKVIDQIRDTHTSSLSASESLTLVSFISHRIGSCE